MTSSTASAASESRFGSTARSVDDEALEHEVGGILTTGRAADADAHAHVLGGSAALAMSRSPLWPP